METRNQGVQVPQEWAEGVDHPLPAEVEGFKAGGIPGSLAGLRVRLGIQRWPDSEEVHIHAKLSESLREVMGQGAKALGEEVLPPDAAVPLDFLRTRHGHEWSDPIQELQTPLWAALANGESRRFGIEYRLAVRINARWGVAPQNPITPRELLLAFEFNPADYSLYHPHSAEPLPPDTPMEVHRGECFEAQKDGRYGSNAVASPRGFQTIEEDVEAVKAAGFKVRLLVEGGQRYVEIGNLEIPSPPWSGPACAILIAVPATYPSGGLDAFYLVQGVHQGGAVPNQQAPVTIGGRSWGLISWHYTQDRPWNSSRDDLASHVAHCRGYFLRRGVR
jgi:Prokaryotic E2 family E